MFVFRELGEINLIHFLKFQKTSSGKSRNFLGKFIPNFSYKHMITSRNFSFFNFTKFKTFSKLHFCRGFVLSHLKWYLSNCLLFFYKKNLKKYWKKILSRKKKLQGKNVVKVVNFLWWLLNKKLKELDVARIHSSGLLDGRKNLSKMHLIQHES